MEILFNDRFYTIKEGIVICNNRIIGIGGSILTLEGLTRAITTLDDAYQREQTKRELSKYAPAV